MGILFKDNSGWGPKQAISNAFFKDILEIIGDKIEYQGLVNEINDSILFYTFTLDYRDRTDTELFLLLEAVIILFFEFDEMYSNRLDEEVIIVYRKSIEDLKDLLKEFFIKL